MDLSIVVLSWNTAGLTVRALRSAAEGVGTLSARRICVDNASADHTVERVRRELPDVVLVENEANLGFAAGNNRALPHLAGRYVCFLNSDCEPGPGSLAHVVRWLDRHPDVGVAAPRMVSPDGRTQKAAREEPRPLGLLHRYTVLRYTPIGRRAARAWRGVSGTATPREVASVTGACLVIRTDLFRELGGFDEGYPFYWEDVDLCRRARDEGWKVVWVADGPSVVHQGGVATAVAGGPPRRSFVEGLLRYQQKHLAPRAGRVFGLVFIVGVLARAFLEPPRLAARGVARAARGRHASARRSFASAASWLRLLERDADTLVRLLGNPR